MARRNEVAPMEPNGKWWRQWLGIGAWVTLAVAIWAFFSGMDTDGPIDPDTGRRSESPRSEYVRQIYEQRVGNDAAPMAKAARILDIAGQWRDSRQLELFFYDCNLRRIQGQDDACTRETVRAAVDQPDLPRLERQLPVDSQLNADLEKALTFSLATEQQIKDGIDRLKDNQRYDSPGILLDDSPTKSAVIVLAVQNQSRWEVSTFSATLTLPAPASTPGASPIVLKCDKNTPPFKWRHPLAPGTTVLRVCTASAEVDLAQLLAAVRQAQGDHSLALHLESFGLKSPYVKVMDVGFGKIQRLMLYTTGWYGSEFAPDEGTRQEINSQLNQELTSVSCQKLDSCASIAGPALIAFHQFVLENYQWVPLFVGLLMGLGIGGLFRRSLAIAIVITMLVVGCFASLIMGGFNSASHQPPGETRGWALWGMMGLSVAAVGGVLLWIPGFFVGVMLVRERPAKS